MKYFKQQQKYGHTYIGPPAEDYTVNPAIDVCVIGQGSAPQEWITANKANAFLIGTAWVSTPGTTAGTLISKVDVYRFRDLTAKSFFMMTFDGESPSKGMRLQRNISD